MPKKKPKEEPAIVEDVLLADGSKARLPAVQAAKTAETGAPDRVLDSRVAWTFAILKRICAAWAALWRVFLEKLDLKNEEPPIVADVAPAAGFKAAARLSAVRTTAVKAIAVNGDAPDWRGGTCAVCLDLLPIEADRQYFYDCCCKRICADCSVLAAPGPHRSAAAAESPPLAPAEIRRGSPPADPEGQSTPADPEGQYYSTTLIAS
jgi:hypothetical protein